MKYDVYFHNDFDGRASAAVMLAFLRSRGDDIEHFTAVNYHLEPQWRDEGFFKKHKLFKGKRNPAIVVDFLYHPKAAWWFEHHATTFKKEAWKKHFEKDKQHHLEPHYASCCHLVYAALKMDFAWKPPLHIVELIKWLDIVDGAQYRSARQTIELKEPALQVCEFIENQSHTGKEDVWIVDLLSRMPLAKIAKEPKIKRDVLRLKKQNAKGLAYAKKNAVIEGGVCFLDRSSAKISFPHFALQYLFPKIRYFVRLSMRGKLYHLNAGLNPWRKKEATIHIGGLLKKFGGGGHKDVGGVEFKTHEQALKASKGVIAAINQSLNHVR